MLQQTQVDRVIPKWHAWLERFPTLGDLASAAPCGGDSRSGRASATTCARCGCTPSRARSSSSTTACCRDSLDGLMTLKGVGRYTAGAVACFAYEQPVAMVDTNVRRVLSRVFGVRAWGRSGAGRSRSSAGRGLRLEPGAHGPRRHAVSRAAAAVSGVPAGSRMRWSGARDRGGAGLVENCGSVTAARPTGAFHGSSRYYRGRVVDTLRQVCAGSSHCQWLSSLSELHRPDEQARVAGLIRRLADEGLLTIEPDQRVAFT